MKFLIEGPVSDYMTNLKNKVTATYDYYMGKRTNKLGNLEDATAAEIKTNKDLFDICKIQVVYKTQSFVSIYFKINQMKKPSAYRLK